MGNYGPSKRIAPFRGESLAKTQVCDSSFAKPMFPVCSLNPRLAGVGNKISRRSVSRVLSMPCGTGRPFLWDAPCGAPRATNPGGGSKTLLLPRLAARSRPPLFGLAPGGVYPAGPVTRAAVRSYRAVSPLPLAPCSASGGLFSVALSLGSPPPAVSRHRISVEPGLSSTKF